jgi:hypothetical protein
MINTFKAGLRNGMTVEKYRAELNRRRMNSIFGHARWAGRHLAAKILLHNDFNLTNSRGELSNTVMTQTLLKNPYCVNPVLLDYAAKVAKEKLQGRNNGRAKHI